MRYNEAAFIGQQRSRAAQMKLFDYAGFAMLTYTIKKNPNDDGFLPVGEELFVINSIYDNHMIIYLTDEEGYAKAQTKPMSIPEGEKILQKISSDGMKLFEGELKTI
ncbi:MAG TPA: hypothetical protein VJU13_12900 [Candidatus Nitrosocosmicus sp.]|jgi:hypothetical protein|nr:hypothetical protein [Candidatus Nitrosocosmicus sp.]